MRNKTTKTITRITMFLSTVCLAGISHAELSMNGQPMLHSAQIGWGDTLEQAEAVEFKKIEPVEVEYISIDKIEADTKRQKSADDSITVIYNEYDQSKQKLQSLETGSLQTQSLYNNDVTNTTYSYASTNDYGNLYLQTKSKAAIVYDLSTGKAIYQKNINSARPIASITKLMTAMVILDAGLNMYDEILVKPFDFQGNGYTKKSSSRMKVGDRLNRSEMLLMTLMKSENPAAKSLARTYPGGYSAFMKAMNRKARSIGMNNTYFGDPTGLDTRNKASVNDLVKLLQAARQYPLIRRYSTTNYHTFNVTNYSHGNRQYRAKNTSRFVREGSYPITLSKTGFIRESGMCMVLETNINNRPSIVVVLGASSYANRNSDIKDILMNLEQRW